MPTATENPPLEPRDTMRAPVLDPIDRASEIVFGVLMATSFTGTLSVATAGAEQVHTMMATALGAIWRGA